MRRGILGGGVALLLGCATAPAAATAPAPATATATARATATAAPAAPAPGAAAATFTGEVVAIRGGTVWTASGKVIEGGVVVMQGERIRAVGGAETAIPDGARVIDARGRHVTPGIIDAHSHMGV